jgi:hypothetical protein
MTRGWGWFLEVTRVCGVRSEATAASRQTTPPRVTVAAPAAGFLLTPDWAWVVRHGSPLALACRSCAGGTPVLREHSLCPAFVEPASLVEPSSADRERQILRCACACGARHALWKKVCLPGVFWFACVAVDSASARRCRRKGLFKPSTPTPDSSPFMGPGSMFYYTPGACAVNPMARGWRSVLARRMPHRGLSDAPRLTSLRCRPHPSGRMSEPGAEPLPGGRPVHLRFLLAQHAANL